MFISSQNSYVKTLIPNVIVYGDRAFGRLLVHEVEPSRSDSAPGRRDMKELASSLSLSHMRMQPEGSCLQAEVGPHRH